MDSLIVMAKAPRAGVAKTRLAAAPELGPDGAARLAAALLDDTLATARGFVRAGGERELVLAFAPDEERAWFASAAPDARLLGQGAGTLSPRLVRATRDAFDRGAHRVVVVGTDAPELSVNDLERAFEALARRAVVLGPSADGGYWLVGLARPCDALFEDVPWSTERVLASTRARAAELGLEVELQDLHFDVDEPADLAHAKRWLASTAVERAPALRAELTRLWT